MVRFDIPAYNKAMSEFADSVLWGIAALDPLIGQIARRRTIHAGPTRNVSGTRPVDHPLTSFHHEFTLHADVIRASQLEEFTWVLFQLAEAHRRHVAQAFTEMLRDITEATGQSLSGGGRPFSLDIFLDVLNMVEIDFDADGNPIMPSVIGGSGITAKLAALEPTQEQDQRLAAILCQKKAEHDAQKRHRRLSG